MSITLLQILILANTALVFTILGSLISWVVTKRKHVRRAEEIENRLTEQIDRIKEELAATEDRFATEHEKAKQLLKEEERLKQKLVEADEQLRELKELQQYLEEQKKQVRKLEETKAELSNRLTERDGQIADQEKVIAEITAERDNQLEELEQKNVELVQTHDELKMAKEEPSRNMEATKQEMEDYKKRADEAEQSTAGTPETDDQLKGVIDRYARKIVREIVKG